MKLFNLIISEKYKIFKKKELIITGIVIILTLSFFAFFIFPEKVKNPQLTMDVYRDVAYARNVLNGNSILQDPAIKGMPLWYPPLNPLIMAGISKITGLSLFTLYNYSPLFINVFIPILFYLFCFFMFNYKIAFFSFLAISIMPWLRISLFTFGMPSIHAFSVILFLLIIFIKFYKNVLSPAKSIIIGILLGFSFLFHSPSALIIYSSIIIFILIKKVALKSNERIYSILIMILLPLIIWSPYCIPNIFTKKLNPEPLQYFSPLLMDFNWVLYIPNQYLCILFAVFMLYGFFKLSKKLEDPNILLLFIIILITIIGQILGYIHVINWQNIRIISIIKKLPYLVPYEFQWYFQLFIIPVIIYGFFELSKLLVKEKHIVFSYIILFILIMPGFFSLFEANKVKTKYKGSYKPSPYIDWIMENTDKNSVFLVSNVQLNFFDLQPHTARKIIFHSAGHMNFNVDVKSREIDNDKLLRYVDINDFSRIAKKYDLEYLLIDKKEIEKDRFDFFLNNFKLVYNYGNFYIFFINNQNYLLY